MLTPKPATTLRADALIAIDEMGGVTGRSREVFFEQIVVPHLRPSIRVFVDRMPFYVRETIDGLLEGTGAMLLPPDSPELNPLEECWSKLNAWPRTRAARR